jgi:hypothetical protein
MWDWTKRRMKERPEAEERRVEYAGHEGHYS